MAIVSSRLEVDAHLQRDGRRGVTERHVDSTGVEHLHVYKPVDGSDYQAVMLARVPRIEAALAESEFLEALEVEGWSPLQHQTAAQFAARFRARYRDASRVECAKLAKWILDRIDGGSFTDAAVRNAFGLTVTQWNALKSSKLTPQRTAYNAVLAAQGE